MTDDGIDVRVRFHANAIHPPTGVIACPDDFVFTESPLILNGIEGDPTYPLAYRNRATGELATREELEAAGIALDDEGSTA